MSWYLNRYGYFTCDICGFQSNKEKTIETHTTTHIPINENNLECTTCNRKFSHRSRLLYHLRSHTKEKPFVCYQPGCKYKSSYRDSLQIHLLNHFDKKKFQCSVCKYGTNYINEFRKHHIKHIPEPVCDVKPSM